MLLGQYVGLRAIESTDLPVLMEWRNNPEYRKYFREYRELNFDMQERWYNDVVLNDSRVIMFSIVELLTNRLLGVTGLCSINWICASRVLIKYAFEELAFHRVWAEIYDFDFRKQKMFKTLGFTLDGRHRQTYWYDNEWHDSLVYSLLCTDKVK